MPIGHQRDTVKLALDSAQQVRHKNVHTTPDSFSRPEVSLEIVVRETREAEWARLKPMCKFRIAQGAAAHEFRSAEQPASSGCREEGKRPASAGAESDDSFPTSRMFSRQVSHCTCSTKFMTRRAEESLACVGATGATNSGANTQRVRVEQWTKCCVD